MIGNTAINLNSIDWDADKIHENDMIHYIEYYPFNRRADPAKYTGAIS